MVAFTRSLTWLLLHITAPRSCSSQSNGSLRGSSSFSVTSPNENVVSESAYSWNDYRGCNAYSGHGATLLDSDWTALKYVSEERCRDHCLNDRRCREGGCVVYYGGGGYAKPGIPARTCWRRMRCNAQQFDCQRYGKGYSTFIPSMSTPVPTPTPFPTPSPEPLILTPSPTGAPTPSPEPPMLTPSPTAAPLPTPTQEPNPLPTPAPAPNNGSSACLCLFDIDRTLTGRQGATATCRNNRELQGVYDSAYSGGTATLSELAAEGISKTFCGACYLGIVSAGHGSGAGSDWNNYLLTNVMRNPLQDALMEANLAYRMTWSYGTDVHSPYVLSQGDRRKQDAAVGILAWYARHGAIILPANVYFFGDRTENIMPFQEMGFNSQEISCESRDWSHGRRIGYCGATLVEIEPRQGNFLCQN